MTTAAATQRLAVITGSVREGRFAPTVTDWFAEEARTHGHFEVDVIDLAEVELPYALGEQRPEGLAAVGARLAAADAFVMVTPEYNHAYPASLKHLIDWHYAEWQAKPVGFVSYGGLAGGLRAVEALRPVLNELHAAPIRDVVSFHGVWEQFGEDGRLKEGSGATAAAKTMLDRLVWWSTALGEARARRPYDAV
ncbi:NADPH-dependent FMN reductase [Streptomyces sp. URMC 123]|uniref:NADPH-dependent FMN reductase n=1 Tax=Streptomyces sp. URMC 123 TaxID=3423403 RepID=UPI003F1A56AD